MQLEAVRIVLAAGIAGEFVRLCVMGAFWLRDAMEALP
jgi:hypothetical protein